MPTIRFDFQGTIVTDVNSAYDLSQGKDVDVSTWTPDQLVSALKSGKVAISLEQSLANSQDTSNVEMTEYSTETESF